MGLQGGQQPQRGGGCCASGGGPLESALLKDLFLQEGQYRVPGSAAGWLRSQRIRERHQVAT